MKLNHAFAQFLLCAIVASLAVWLEIEHQARLQLVKEQQTLEEQVRQMSGLAARNEQMSNQLAQLNAPKPLTPDQLMELLRLRGEASVLNQQQSSLDFDKTREENSRIHDALNRYLGTLSVTNSRATPNYWPQESWTNCGYGSPEAALQTMVWAGSNGDVTNFLASVTDEGRKEFATSYKDKSHTEVSIQMADETYDLQSIQILGREVQNDTTVLLTVEMENRNDFETIKMVMKKEGEGWRFSGPAH